MLDPTTLAARFGDFFDHYGPGNTTYAKLISAAADSYPDVRSVHFDFPLLNTFDHELAEYLLENPEKAIKAAEEAMREAMPPESKVPLAFRLKSINSTRRVEIRSLRKRHIGTLVTVEGLVRKATEVRPRITRAVFQCQRCGAHVGADQTTKHLEHPLECPADGGCGRAASSTKFIYVSSETDRIDTQKIEVQEPPEGLRGGAQPQRLTAWADDDIAGILSPGDRVALSGILMDAPKGTKSAPSTLTDIYLQVNAIETEQHEFEEIEISKEDVREILKLRGDPMLAAKVGDSIAPTIFGMDMEKEALALQLFGGVPKMMSDGTKIRGDIHLLFVGDPGTAKSQLLRYISSLAPRGIYASGKSSSAAGLTAAAVKDEFGEGRWTLEAGTLVLADRGVACIDELDKMTPQDRSAMHEAMEQQTITVSKAGINATLQSRCSILGAANPKLGRFDKYHTIADQINLPPALMSRFDAIFSITDEPNQAKDADLADHVLAAHRTGAAIAAGRDVEIPPALEPAFGRDFLRKYIAYARRNHTPVLTLEAHDTLKVAYLAIRKQGEGEGASVPITPRALEAFVRLAEASARMHLRGEVTAEDADRSVRVMEYWMTKAVGGSGGLDIDIIATGTSKSQRDKIKTIRNLMDDLAAASDTGLIDLDDLIEQADGAKIGKGEVKDLLGKLKQEGDIYFPKMTDEKHFRLSGRRA